MCAVAPVREVIEFLDIATADHHVVRIDRRDELIHDFEHGVSPTVEPVPLESGLARVVLEALVPKGHMPEFKRLKLPVLHHGRSEARPKAEKEHATAVVTPEGLHGGVIEHANRAPECGLKVESDPASTEIRWIEQRSPTHHRRWVPDGDAVPGPVGAGFLHRLDHDLRGEMEAGLDLPPLLLALIQDLEVRTTNVDDQRAHRGTIADGSCRYLALQEATMRVVLAGDHAGLSMRADLAAVATALGHEVVLVGPCEGERVDFPMAAEALCREIMAGRAHRGILLCGSGAGMAMAANRFPGIRAATAHDTYTAHQMVEHDAANVLTLGTRVVGPEPAAEIVRAYLTAEFQPVDRYRRRLQQIIDIERKRTMNPLHDLSSAGQAIWLDYIRRDILDDGTLSRYIADLCVTGLTSNPSIFDKAISGSDLYDSSMSGGDPESIFFDLAIDDLGRAADLLRTSWDVSGGTDGCVSLEVSPLLAADAASTIEQGITLFERAARPNLMIKVPGTPEAPEAIEELIYRGVNVNVTLLFDEVQYRRAAEAYLAGIERRLADGLDARVFSVASVFISRWDTPTADRVDDTLKNRLGIACGTMCHRACEEIFESNRFRAIEDAGGHRQKLLMASTSTKDPSLPDTLYVTALAAADSINTIPEATLLAFADHGAVAGTLGANAWSEAAEVIAGYESAGVDVRSLAEQLQTEGAEAFVKSWRHLLQTIESKAGSLATN